MVVFSFLLWFFFNVRTNTTIQINEIPPKSPPIRSPVLPGESVESVGSAGCDSVDKVDSDSGLELGLGTLLLIDPTPGLGLELLLLAASGLGFGPLLSPSVESAESAGCDGVDKVDSDSGLELGLGTLLLIDPTPGLGLELLLLAASGLGFGPLLSPAFGAELEQAATHASIAIDPFEPTNMSSDLGALELTQ